MNERAVSVTVGYIINLSIATMLIAGLLTSTAGVVDAEREQAIRSQLDVVGERLAADLMTADRLVQSSDASTTVELETRLPSDAAGASYQITISATGSQSTITLSTNRPAVERQVTFKNETNIQSGTVSGGDVVIVVNGDGKLEVSE